MTENEVLRMLKLLPQVVEDADARVDEYGCSNSHIFEFQDLVKKAAASLIQARRNTERAGLS